MDQTNNCPSLYIPRVYSNISPIRIQRVFEELFGAKCVERVDTSTNRKNEKGEEIRKVFVHFKYWPKSSQDTKDRILKGEEIQVVYKEPWFWKCILSKLDKPVKNKGKNKPYIINSNFVPPTPLEKEEKVEN